MNDLLWKRHGIQPRSDQRKHLHAYVDAAVLDKVDEMDRPDRVDQNGSTKWQLQLESSATTVTKI